VGLAETDQHIRFFWRVLESLQPDELRMFVKFACNLERLPTTCSCKKAGSDAHVPPYPMKLAPPDGSGVCVCVCVCVCVSAYSCSSACTHRC
jgi:E3 ubiquitin-protein ligase HECTD4